jgi:hypothetical protein
VTQFISRAIWPESSQLKKEAEPSPPDVPKNEGAYLNTQPYSFYRYSVGKINVCSVFFRHALGVSKHKMTVARATHPTTEVISQKQRETSPYERHLSHSLSLTQSMFCVTFFCYCRSNMAMAASFTRPIEVRTRYATTSGRHGSMPWLNNLKRVGHIAQTTTQLGYLKLPDIYIEIN